MNKITLLIISLVLNLMMVFAPKQSHAISVLGIDTGTTWDYATVPYLSGVTFTEVSTAGFATTNLNLYDVLMVSETFTNGAVTTVAQATLDALKSREGDISSWLSTGHGILALSEPNGSGRFDWLPDALQPTVGTMIHDDTVHIVNNLHPVMSGLTDDGLSGWGTSSHGSFTSTAGWDVLVTDGDSRAITMAATYGLGKIVITDQDADFHKYYGNYDGKQQVQFVQNAVNWLSEPLPNQVPEPSTLLLGSGLIGLAGMRRRFKA